MDANLPGAGSVHFVLIFPLFLLSLLLSLLTSARLLFNIYSTLNKDDREIGFGERLRSLREARGIGLRKFAEEVGMSATYLSKVERGQFLPPSEDKVRTMAQALDQDEDEFLALAGRVSADLPTIIRKRPREMATFLRTADGLPAEHMNTLIEKAAEMKQDAKKHSRDEEQQKKDEADV